MKWLNIYFLINLYIKLMAARYSFYYRAKLLGEHIVYTKAEFGKDLKWKLTQTQNIEEIKDWAFKILFRFPYEIEKDLKDILLTLAIIDNKPEFKLSIEEIKQLADDLENCIEPRIKIVKSGKQ